MVKVFGTAVMCGDKMVPRCVIEHLASRKTGRGAHVLFNYGWAT